MKDLLTCYIIDDEPLAQEILEAYIAKVPFLELKGTFASPIEAAVKMAIDNPDLLFLDINMPDLDGLSFLKMLNSKPLVVLTTAYDQYALKAFDLEVNDYLLKPFSFERFYKSVLRLYQKHDVSPNLEKNNMTPSGSDNSGYIFLKVGYRIQKIDLQNILFIEGMKDYLRIHTVNDKVMTLISFAKLEMLLPADKFVRVHRSYMVAIDKIDHIEKSRIKIGKESIPISETYSDDFYKKLNGLQ